MKIKHTKILHTSNDRVVTMEAVKIQYEKRDVDLDEVKRIAKASSMRIQRDRDELLNKAIKNHDSFFIRKELSNVSSYELTKMLIDKMLQRIHKK